MKYRREIDGLRALAVVPVVLFHGGFHFFKGGFVGVDVFFVISGYLITSIILSEKEAGTFSLIGFYERRARRILPALYVVMAACIPMAWWWMQPGDMKDFSISLVAVPAFASNILFWRDQLGYSPAAAQVKPLLHTWSLAVEEQFYVLFPFFIMLTWGLGKRWLIGLLAIIALISLAGAQWGAYSKPVATFLLLPTRGWEIAIGALTAAYLAQRNAVVVSISAQQALSGVGLLLIVYAVIVFDKTIPFPSFYALVPTAGTALIILFAVPQTIVGAMLGSKTLVGIGLISYSAYLWHQPLFAFARHIIFTSEPGAELMLLLSVTSFVLAYASWRFVELPFRNRTLIDRDKVFLFAGSATGLFIAFGVAGYITDGFMGRYPAPDQELLVSIAPANVNRTMRAHGLDKCYVFNGALTDLFDKKCFSTDATRPKVVIFGDSHAAHLSAGVRHFFGREGYVVDQWTIPGCYSMFLPEYAGNVGLCRDLYTAFVEQLMPTLKKGDVVILSLSWPYLPTAVLDSDLVNSLRDRFARLKDTPATIVVFGSSPSFTRAPQAIAIRQQISGQNEIHLESGDVSAVNEFLKNEATSFGFKFFDPSKAMCTEERVRLCIVKHDNVFLYLDHGHLSEYGSIYLLRALWVRYGKEFTGLI